MAGRGGKEAGTRVAGISSEAVAAGTGRTWKQWLSILDRWGARKKTHKEIAAHLHEAHGLPGWWSQMVTVGYEQARGMREVHETAEGFVANASRTVAAPVAELYRAWEDPRARARWLREAITIRKATRCRSLRVTWKDRRTGLDVHFTSKGDARSRVAVRHRRLGDAAAVRRMKAFWSAALDRLEGVLERRGGVRRTRRRGMARSRG